MNYSDDDTFFLDPDYDRLCLSLTYLIDPEDIELDED